MNNPTRKERDRKIREEDFLAAAEQLMANKGYFQTSMEDIAREAQYATGTIYRYFDSKEALFRELLHRKMGAYFEFVCTRVREHETPLEQLRAMLNAKFDFFESNPGFLQLYSVVFDSAYRMVCPGGDERCTQVQTEYCHLLREVITRGIDQGVFRNVDIDLCFAGFSAFSNSVLMHATTTGGNVEPARALAWDVVRRTLVEHPGAQNQG